MSGEPQTDGTYHEVGSFYVVPCVRAGWPNIDDKPRWWPILGPQHEDGEFINFPYQHFHVDYRFLDAKARKLVSVALGSSLAFSAVITANNIVPEDREPDQSNSPGPKGVRGLPSTCPPVDRIAEDVSWLRTRRLKCKAQWPAYPDAKIVHWLGALEMAYSGQRLKRGLVCPHKGTDLSTIKPDGMVITCPLHGLRWNVRTGELAPRPSRQQTGA